MTLLSERELANVSLLDWQRQAVTAFREKMTDPTHRFPCIPATQAYALQHLRYAFVGDPREETTAISLAGAMNTFSEQCRDYGKYTTLIVFYDTPAPLLETSLETFERLFWEQLSALRERDERPWPDNIPMDPDIPAWEFCFRGEAYFMYCATPLHRERQSRSFPYMMLAITPRWVLTSFQENALSAERIKHQIRKRLAAYDTAAPHPELRTYGEEDNYEWKQYFLRDDDTSLTKCPFLRMLHSKKE